jgi:hypothetical protein
MTARTDDELEVGSWRIRMPVLSSSSGTAAKAGTVAGVGAALSHSLEKAPASPISRLKAQRERGRGREQGSTQEQRNDAASPVLQVDHYGNRYAAYQAAAPMSPPTVVVPAAAVPHPPTGSISSSNQTLKFTAGNRRVLRKVVAIEVEDKEAITRDIAMRGRSMQQKTKPFIAKIPLHSHAPTANAAQVALETHAKLLKLPIAEAFKAYSVETISRGPVCL